LCFEQKVLVFIRDKKKVFPPGFNVTLVYSEEAVAGGGGGAANKPAQHGGKENLRRKNELAHPTLMNL
jgi:hypothetical protein